MANGNDVTSSIRALSADLMQPGKGKKKATRFSGGFGLCSCLPASIERYASMPTL